MSWNGLQNLLFRSDRLNAWYDTIQDFYVKGKNVIVPVTNSRSRLSLILPSSKEPLGFRFNDGDGLVRVEGKATILRDFARDVFPVLKSRLDVGGVEKQQQKGGGGSGGVKEQGHKGDTSSSTCLSHMHTEFRIDEGLTWTFSKWPFPILASRPRLPLKLKHDAQGNLAFGLKVS